MDVSIWVMSAIALCVLVLMALILLLDCDLTLAFKEKCGKPLNSLQGQVIWIVGASTGIGEYLAYELVSNGAKVVLSARRVTELARVKSKCLDVGRKLNVTEADILVIPLDISRIDQHRDAFDQVISHFGQLDILVNNAGRSQRAHWLDINLELDRDLFEGNVFGLLHLTRIVLPHFLAKKKGHIAVTSSVCGKIGAPFSASYNATKHALHGYFETARAELAPQGVSITMLCPGPVFSDLLTNCATGKYGQKLGGSMNSKDRRMTTDRCAHLCAIAIVNHLDEAWISINPVLLSLYAAQYIPSLFRSYFARYGAKRAMKLRDSGDEHLKEALLADTRGV